MKGKKLSWMVLFLVFALVLAACGGNESSNKGESTSDGAKDEGKTYTIKAGHSQTEEHPYHLALLDLAENVKERTDGKVTIEIFPLNQLGAERELTEALTLGTADMSISSTAPIANFYPQIGIVDLPFLFESRAVSYTHLTLPTIA